MPLYGDVKFQIKADNENLEAVSIEIPRDNAYGNIKRVCKNSFNLKKGNQKVSIEITEGNCYPDLIEFVPESDIKGTPEYIVYTYWHGVLRREGSNWKSNSLSFAVTNDSLYIMIRGRFGNDMTIRNFKEAGAGESAKYSVKIIDHSGAVAINLKSEDAIRSVGISRLKAGAYLALISDGNSYWIAKQFIKYGPPLK
jgi:hypothetical protein